jgi:integrase
VQMLCKRIACVSPQSGDEAMKIWRKQTTKQTLRGRETIYSKRFYGTLRLASGKRKQVPLTETLTASRTLLRRLQTEQDNLRASGVSDASLERLRDVDEHLDAYATYLRSKGNTERYVALAVYRIRTLLDATKTSTLAELDTERTANTLALLRQRGTSIATSNHYARALKGFSRWAWTERKTTDDPLRSLRLLNGSVGVKRRRRALTPDEIKRLLDATQASGVSRSGLSPTDRAMLYRVACFTGLRAQELASLERRSFDLEAKTIKVQAAYSKRRRDDTLPLNASLVAQLERWLTTKVAGTLWRGTWAGFASSNVVRMLRSDLKRAGIAYESDGAYVDFHALRHTFVSSLARSGVHPLKAKELARHSTITLTMDVYAHVQTEELREAIDALPAC